MSLNDVNDLSGVNSAPLCLKNDLLTIITSYFRFVRLVFQECSYSSTHFNRVCIEIVAPVEWFLLITDFITELHEFPLTKRFLRKTSMKR